MTATIADVELRPPTRRSRRPAVIRELRRPVDEASAASARVDLLFGVESASVAAAKPSA
jgi:hypothetical protein